MSERIEAGSQAHLLFLYDPAGVPEDLAKRGTKRKWEPLVKEGALLAFRTHEFDPYSIEVFTDEEPAVELRARGKSRVRGALLRVPSGLLRYCGADVCGEKSPKNQDDEPADAALRVPAGNYEIEVLETGYGDDDRERIEAEVLQREGRMSLRLDKWLTVAMAILLLGGVLPGRLFWFLGGLGIALADGGWRAALKFGGVGIVVILVCYALCRLLDSVPLVRRMRTLREELKGDLDELPDFVLVMRRLPAGGGLSGMKGGSFGPVR